MHLTDADKHTAYETTADVFTHPGPCPQCGEDAPCYEDRTGEVYCLPCLTDAVETETEAVNAQEWDWMHRENTRRAQEAAVPALRYAPTADYPF